MQHTSEILSKKKCHRLLFNWRLKIREVDYTFPSIFLRRRFLSDMSFLTVLGYIGENLGIEDVILMVGFNNPCKLSKVLRALLLVVIHIANVNPLFQQGWR